MSLQAQRLGNVFFPLPVWKTAGFPSPGLLLFPHLVDLRVLVCLRVARFAEKPREQDGPDADCRELLRAGHGVWQSDVLSTHGEGDSACARALHCRR